MEDSHYQVKAAELANRGIDFNDILWKISSVYTSVWSAKLGEESLGVIGNSFLPDYERWRGALTQDLQYGKIEAEAIGEKVFKSGDRYLKAEDDAAQAVLAAAQRSSLPKNTDAPGGTPYYEQAWRENNMLSAGGISTRGHMVAGGAGVVAGVTAPAAQWAIHHERHLVRTGLRSAEASKAVMANLMRCRTFSLALVAAVATWWVTVIPTDEDLNSAVAWLDRASTEAGKAFGRDTPEVREAITRAWEGETMRTADARIVDFMAAGLQAGFRAGRMADALEGMAQRLNVVHKSALALSVLLGGAIIAAGALSRIHPAARLVAEAMGGKLAAALAVCANLIPILIARGLMEGAWEGATDGLEINGRVVPGFRTPQDTTGA
ncbi:hypothetical protein [Nonomuraea indica]|uniref:hypothetical protein n=1 Tax=Nonomuraea indica TaxID=1581193 RepID=UPI001183514F|nr:hypothetical protein [Nonomuraea indica]